MLQVKENMYYDLHLMMISPEHICNHLPRYFYLTQYFIMVMPTGSSCRVFPYGFWMQCKLYIVSSSCDESL